MSEQTPKPGTLPPAVFVPDDGGELFDESQLPIGRDLLWPDDVQRKRFTAEHVARNAGKYRAIVSALGEGLGIRQIARAFGVSHHTVAAIRERDAALVATEKEQMGRKFMRLARLAAERLEEALVNDQITPGQLPVAVGILADKSLMWTGQAVTQHVVRHEFALEAVKAQFAAVFEKRVGPPVELQSSEGTQIPEETGLKREDA
jgi:hypothetical protein